MFNKLLKFLKLPFYEKLNLSSSIFHRMKTQYFYKLFFKNIGKKSTIRKPIILINVQKIDIQENVFIRDSARIECIISKGIQKFNPKLTIENGVSFEQRCHIIVGGELTISKNAIISFDVMITDTEHEYENINLPISAQPLKVSKTYIGENCFIGSGVKIQAGTILGKHCVIGANSVVRGTFPDYCVIVGIPAQIIKKYDEKSKTWKRTNNKGEFLNEI
jgi:acetyltransferase-like isoleucine patch superfamily enzyme